MCMCYYHRWNGVTDRSGMAVLEVGLPTGYRLGVWNLQKYVLANRDKTSIRGAEFNGKDGIGIFYFDYVSDSYSNLIVNFITIIY